MINCMVRYFYPKEEPKVGNTIKGLTHKKRKKKEDNGNVFSRKYMHEFAKSHYFDVLLHTCLEIKLKVLNLA